MKRRKNKNKAISPEKPLDLTDPFSLEMMIELPSIEAYDHFERAMEFSDKHGMSRERALARYSRLRLELDDGI